jgi:hypothetical protein
VYCESRIRSVASSPTHTPLSSQVSTACSALNRHSRPPTGYRWKRVRTANRDVRDFGWEIAHAAVSRRPPISLSRIVPRTEGYTHNATVWDSSIVQGLISVAPCRNPTRYDSPLFIIAVRSAPEASWTVSRRRGGRHTKRKLTAYRSPPRAAAAAGGRGAAWSQPTGPSVGGGHGLGAAVTRCRSIVLLRPSPSPIVSRTTLRQCRLDGRVGGFAPERRQVAQVVLGAKGVDRRALRVAQHQQHLPRRHSLRIVTFRDFGWESAHGAVTRRPPIPLHTMVFGTGGYAYAVGGWDLSVVQRPFSSPRAKPSVTIREFLIAAHLPLPGHAVSRHRALARRRRNAVAQLRLLWPARRLE